MFLAWQSPTIDTLLTLDDRIILLSNDFTRTTNFFNYFNLRKTEINSTFDWEIENKRSFLDTTIEEASNIFTTTKF